MTQEIEENKKNIYNTNTFQTRTCQKVSQTPKEDFKYKQENQSRIKIGTKRFNFKKGLHRIDIDDYMHINNQSIFT